MSKERTLQWPTLPEVVLPENLNDDDFYRRAVTVMSDKKSLYAKVQCSIGLDLPLEMITEFKGEMGPEDIAFSTMERILVDLQTELYPVLRRKLKEHFDQMGEQQAA